MEASGQSVRHRQLANELRRLREAKGLSTIDVAEHMGWDRTKVNRIERGQWKRLNPQDVRALADCYGVSDHEHREALMGMARQTKLKGWWERYSDLLGSSSYIALESEATCLRSFEALVVPGLFQTADYAAALMQGRCDASVIGRRTELRLTRQRHLDGNNPLQVRSIVDEAALRKLVGGPAVMRAQLHHLVAANEKPNVELHIIPDSVGAHPGTSGQFVILDFPFGPDASVVFLENAHDGLYLEDRTDIERYNELFKEVLDSSLSSKESSSFITNELIPKIVD
ncbi:helix-turn-helix transcriptional regulator [Lipingzhangella sp. LS1_29]|uniref:Helix-turn-helix transcriptional regulator n=1 Tax=Lipingzhangella rawalii TaxID=2055835 RepID=A0ABU2HAK5_9ACTN|nr:helix-turn-helix transcriptional regulator [Lipingzhangella rawalii]MDS1272296.1 helix-turn-helix transcriptional regulator [Lipingzhangella rawalii]